MTGQPSSSAYRIMMFVGLGDIALGVLVAVLALTGADDAFDPMVLAAAGGVFALTGVGVVLFTRHKLSEADSRRGNLN